VVVDLEKIKEIMDWHAPRNLIEVRYLMGLDGYHRIFIKGFPNIGHPITSLQRKNKKFIWSTKCEASFQQLEHLLTNVLVLKIADPKNDFLVCIDYYKELINGFVI
jgi:hypothetical protein